MTATECAQSKTLRRAPAATRRRLLWSAYEQLHRYGYQGMRVAAVVASAGVRKGAFYHHFASKRALAFAVLDEIIVEKIEQNWTATLCADPDPVAAIVATLDRAVSGLSEEDLELGCPLCNLAQEMSPIDNEFRRRLARVLDIWTGRVAAALSHGQAAGRVRAAVDCERSAAFIVSALQGCIMRAKTARDLAVLRDSGRELVAYLQTLRA